MAQCKGTTQSGDRCKNPAYDKTLCHVHRAKRTQKQAKRDAIQREKDAQVLSLSIGGASLQQIADGLGYKSVSGVHKAYRRALERITVVEPSEELKKELLRLDAIFIEAFRQAKQGINASAKTCLEVMTRRAKYLGIDAADRLEISGPEGRPLIEKVVIHANEDDE